MKKKLLMPFESPREHYKADATVVWCFDDRLTLSLQVLHERMGWKNFDLIKVAGGVRDLANLGEESERKYILGQIGKSLKLHHSPEVFLMAHYNCGAFNREQIDQSDDEDRFFATELTAGKLAVEQYLATAGLSAKVRLLLCDFRNIYELED